MSKLVIVATREHKYIMSASNIKHPWLLFGLIILSLVVGITYYVIKFDSLEPDKRYRSGEMFVIDNVEYVVRGSSVFKDTSCNRIGSCVNYGLGLSIELQVQNVGDTDKKLADMEVGHISPRDTFEEYLGTTQRFAADKRVPPGRFINLQVKFRPRYDWDKTFCDSLIKLKSENRRIGEVSVQLEPADVEGLCAKGS